MAFLEWRRLNFFDLDKEVNSGNFAEILKDTTVKVACSGNSRVVVCDVTGWVYLVSRTWEVNPFRAYELSVTLAQQFQHDPYLVTVGEDETGVAMLKVWDWSRKDENPTCVRRSRAVPSHMRPTPPTALAVHENKTMLAVGFADGSVSVFRGDVTRQRSTKMKTLPDTGTSPITALAFKGLDQLFVVTGTAVLVCGTSGERILTLDAEGAAPGCSVLSGSDLMVARSDAIYCYTTEGRGPCYALEGTKKRLDWFRNYLVITTVEPNVNGSQTKANHITILDIQNKFIVFSMKFDEIAAVLTEWGSFYILTKNNDIMFLDEKDLQSKLSLLFKKNLFHVAIKIASSQHYDTEGLTEIYKQYGDHLYAKSDFKGAIEQYIKTIGRLETSYVIRKYLESRHLEPLVLYLQELHKKGLATEDHTTLLLTCFMKIDQHDQHGKLKEFINSKNSIIDFDVDIAIKVVRQVSIEDALLLASNYKRHDWYLKIMLEDEKHYSKALEYIADLDFDDADYYMKKYGNLLIQNIPKESTDFLKILCTDYKPRNKPLVDEAMMSGLVARGELDKALPDDYIHLFLSNSEMLIEFLEHMTSTEKGCSKLVYNALIEHYIHVWSKAVAPSEKLEYEQKVMNLLKNSESNYDKDQTLIICQMQGFKPGIVHLYEENKLWRAQLSLHMRSGDAEGALAVCRRRGAAAPRLWLDALWWPPPAEALPELLNVIANERLLSPMLVIDSLASTTSCTLGDIRKYLMDVLKSESDVTSREAELADKYRQGIKKMKQQIHVIQREPQTFQGSRCAACNHTLELPTVHFLCQHSFHQHCFQSFCEGDGECPACAPAVASMRAAAAPPRAAETLHARLHAEPDPYAVVSEYLGRGLFNKLTVVTDGLSTGSQGEPVTSEPRPAAVVPVHAPTYGPGAEARLRLDEGQSKQVFTAETSKQQGVPKGTTIVPIPEGRMRVLEQQRAEHKYSSSLEANITKLHMERSIQVPMNISSDTLERASPVLTRKDLKKRLNVEPVNYPTSSGTSPKISSFIQNPASKEPSGNPFGDDFEAVKYDDTKNPFADSGNDADDEDDYDKNLNPFA